MNLETIVNSCRNKYNSMGSKFWDVGELYQLIYEACLRMAIETKCIERTFETVTAPNVQEYDLPEYAIGVKRVTWNGKKLDKISFDDDDLLTGFFETTASTGNPQQYLEWQEKIRLRPIPAGEQPLLIYTYNEPQPITTGSILEIPTRYHVYLLDYVLSCMVFKDEKFDIANKFLDRFELNLLKIESNIKQLKRAGANGVVKSEEVCGRNLFM